MIGRPPRPPLFPYTPLFRSKSEEREPELREAQAGAVHSREGSVDVAKLGRNEQDGEPPFLRERRGRRSSGGHGVNDRRGEHREGREPPESALRGRVGSESSLD